MPKAFGSIIASKIPTELLGQLRESARAHDRTVSAEVRVILREHFARMSSGGRS